MPVAVEESQPNEEVCSTGDTTFPSTSSTSYRYKLTAKGEFVHLWLGRRGNPAQWEANDFHLVSSDSSLANVARQDLISIFRNCLERVACEKASECERDLVQLGNDQVGLEFKISVNVCNVELNAIYRFTMTRIAMSELEVAETRLQDKDKELQELYRELDLQITTSKPLLLSGKASELAVGDILRFERVYYSPKSDNFELDGLGNTITFQYPGRYAVNFNLYQPKKHATSLHFELWVRGPSGSNFRSHNVHVFGTSSWFSDTQEFDASDQLYVFCQSDADWNVKYNLQLVKVS